MTSPDTKINIQELKYLEINMTKKIIVTGGYGYIGSHTVTALQTLGYELVVVDNLINSTQIIGRKLELLSRKRHKFFEVDLLDKNKLIKLFETEMPDYVIHFAGLKAVAESVENPNLYYRNNIESTLNLLDSMEQVGCNDIVFSSSATVYGSPIDLPIKESHPLNPTNPYGWSKFFCEQIISDWVKSKPTRSSVILRYFNPIGAHKSGLLGDDPNSTPNNLMPYIVSVAKGDLEELNIYADDYQTIDGTGVRDYLHVVDLADAHVAAMKSNQPGNSLIFNLGTGRGTSVLELIRAFERVNNVKVDYKIVSRREGDVAEVYADVQLAATQLQWRAQQHIEEMCKSAWDFGRKRVN